jgi:putative ABC transport system substrate-binding protein
MEDWLLGFDTRDLKEAKALAWPLAAQAQPSERMRRVGVLTPLPADDPEAKARHAVFLESLRQLGWS